eukprot:scaffold21060_cov112-Isochrysis_galbana.AAC.3
MPSPRLPPALSLTTRRTTTTSLHPPPQVFKTVGRGWGVRSREPVKAGTFVCEYTGVMLRDEVRAAHTPSQSYPNRPSA